MFKNQLSPPTNQTVDAADRATDNELDENLSQSSPPKTRKSRSDNRVHVDVKESVGAFFLGLLALLLLLALLRTQADYRKLAERLL